MKTLFENGDLPENKLSTLKLEKKVIKEVIKLCKNNNQCGQTMLNTIYQLEFIHQQESVINNKITDITDEDVIGSLLLSSKYFESTYKTRFTPKKMEQIVSKKYTIKQICQFEMNVIKKLDYNVDKLLMNQYNYYQCLNDILITKSIKEYFKKDINHKNYTKLCKNCQNIAIELMFHLGTINIDQFHEISLAVSIIFIGFQSLGFIFQSNHQLQLIHDLGMLIIILLLFILQKSNSAIFISIKINSETNKF